MTPQQLIRTIHRTTRTKIIPYISKNYAFLALVCYCVYSFNWVATAAFVLVLWFEYYISELLKIIEDDNKEIEKWHKKYMEVKYPKLNK